MSDAARFHNSETKSKEWKLNSDEKILVAMTRQFLFKTSLEVKGLYKRVCLLLVLI